MTIPQFLHDIDLKGRERLDKRGNNRDVYSVDDLSVDGVNYNQFVVKSASTGAKGQNKKAVRAYLDSLERDQDFLPPFVGGTADFDLIVVGRLNPIDNHYSDHPWRENPKKSDYDKAKREVLPDGWSENDDNIELGVDPFNCVKILDAGTLHRTSWEIPEDPLDYDAVDTTSIDGIEYFTIDI
jgi:hypothetical protein